MFCFPTFSITNERKPTLLLSNLYKHRCKATTLDTTGITRLNKFIILHNIPTPKDKTFRTQITDFHQRSPVQGHNLLEQISLQIKHGVFVMLRLILHTTIHCDGDDLTSASGR